MGWASPSGSAETVPPQAAKVIAAAARRLNTDFDDMATPCRLAIRRDNDTGGSKVPWRRCHVFEMNCFGHEWLVAAINHLLLPPPLADVEGADTRSIGPSRPPRGPPPPQAGASGGKRGGEARLLHRHL